MVPELALILFWRVFFCHRVNEVRCVKLENLSFRQVAVGIFLLALLNWAFLQFVALPNMSDQGREGIYYSFRPKNVKLACENLLDLQSDRGALSSRSDSCGDR